MSVTWPPCSGVKLPGPSWLIAATPQLQWHHYSQSHPAVYFELPRLCACARDCVHVWEWMFDRERNRLALYVIQCVKAAIPISMIISFSLWAKTATLIQFISSLFTDAEMLGQGELLLKSFRAKGWRSLLYRWEKTACRTGWMSSGAVHPYRIHTRGLESMNI